MVLSIIATFIRACQSFHHSIIRVRRSCWQRQPLAPLWREDVIAAPIVRLAGLIFPNAITRAATLFLWTAIRPILNTITFSIRTPFPPPARKRGTLIFTGTPTGTIPSIDNYFFKRSNDTKSNENKASRYLLEPKSQTQFELKICDSI